MVDIKNLILPPHADEGLKVGLADAELPAEAVGYQVAGRNPAAYCQRRDPEDRYHLPNSEQGGEGVLGSVNGFSRHGVLLRR